MTTTGSGKRLAEDGGQHEASPSKRAPRLEYFNLSERTDAMEFDKPIENHPEKLYLSTLPQTYNLAPSLSDVEPHHVEQFGQQGYLVLKSLLDAAGVNAVLDALAETIASSKFQLDAAATALDQKSGKVNLSRGGLNPVLQFEAFAADIPVSERYAMSNIRKLMGFHEHHETLKKLANNIPLLELVRRLLIKAGLTEEDVREIDIFQSLALLKPVGGREKPWHQDNAYFDVDYKRVKMVGVWIALSEVTKENGAMHVLPKALSQLEPLNHFNRRDFQICDEEVMRSSSSVVVPLEPGGALFFSTMLPHGTPKNTSGQPRYAIQFHFIPRAFADNRCATENRQAIWGGDAKPGVSC